MVFRLVLGCGTVGRQTIGRLPECDDRLLVVTEDEQIVETLRDRSVPAREADPTDPGVLEGVERPALVFVAGDRTDRNRIALERARERFPSATIVAYLGGKPTPEDRAAFDELADRVVDPERALGGAVLEATTSPAADAAIRLRQRLLQIDGRLAVMMHDNPDPDAIASAVALAEIAESVGVPADPCYFGQISHQENRAMVNVLGLDLRNLEPGATLEEYDAVALVDHSRPGVNDQLSEDRHVDIVIDHHPPRGPVPSDYVDLREHAGATSTVLTEYLEQFGPGFDRATATALLYGIRVDTDEFTREASSADFEAAATLWSHVDTDVLRRIERPSLEGETLDTIARAIKNREQRGPVAVASAGRIGDRDALPQAADRLLTMEGVDTSLVFGFIDEMVFVSARSRAGDVDLGEVVRDAFDRIGSAGGHADMAGAQLEIGILGAADDEQVDSIVSVVEEVITDRFFEAIESQPGTPVGSYTQTSEVLFTLEDEE
ncbi:DHH family phosphoesterase [Natronococcus jeotgali]|uniref:Phosphoesterase RecJ domain-containing protein n=1 Tax=Natronococcus jeotgali DSM 18795 TaxID=1227498 RepID=L9WSX0_9EURY|nr:DHH family phosphoesterase [Natronococcus jeotgali]ELY52321.1 phosphoesterase RecJ domain-containing protein [Natronococcus jeotgali DSM 18795]